MVCLLRILKNGFVFVFLKKNYFFWKFTKKLVEVILNFICYKLKGDFDID